MLDALCAMNNNAPPPTSPQQTAAVASFAIDGRLSEPVKQSLWEAFNTEDGDEVNSETGEAVEVLTDEEIAPLVYYLWEHLGEDQTVIDLFKKNLDINKDGKITKSEFMGAADKAFAMAAAAWPRPSPAEVVASMRVYPADMCMQGECCARITRVCTEGDPEFLAGADNATLFAAHGAIRPCSRLSRRHSRPPVVEVKRTLSWAPARLLLLCCSLDVSSASRVWSID